MKFSIKYFILVLSMVYSVMANSQYGDIIVTKSYCNQNDAGAAKVRLHIPSMDLAWNQPPYIANIKNLDTDQEWEISLNIVEGNYQIGNAQNLPVGDYEVIVFVTDRCFLRLAFKIEAKQKFKVEYFKNTLCENETLLIWTVNGQNSQQGFKYLWSNGGTWIYTTISTPGVYIPTIKWIANLG